MAREDIDRRNHSRDNRIFVIPPLQEILIGTNDDLVKAFSSFFVYYRVGADPFELGGQASVY